MCILVVLVKPNLLSIVVCVRKLQHDAQLVMELCTCFCGVSFGLIGKLYLRQDVCCSLYLRKLIGQQLQGAAILGIVGQ